jgi:acetyl esterase/lipase
MIRSATVLAAALRGGGAPRRRTRIAGIDALVAEPRGCSRPVVVYANAATPRGVDEPAVGRFLGGLAAAGFVAVAPELPGVRRGEMTPDTIDALVSVASACGRRVALVGASTGAGLVILAASDPRLAGRVTSVASIAPFASLRNILRLGTTGYYEDRRFDAAPLVGTAARRSLSASAPDDPVVPALLANQGPDRFEDLYAALAPDTRALVEELSPLSRIGRVDAPIEVASSPTDPFFPVEESLALAEAGHDVRLTVTPALLHVKPCLRPGLIRIVGMLDRTLARASAVEPASALRPSVA